MQIERRAFWPVAVMAAMALAAPAGALAQASSASPGAWASKPIRWIVPFPPGGPADIVARVLGHKLAERAGQPAVIENRPGAGGNLGHEAAAKAAPDGYSLLFVVPSIVTNPFFYRTGIDPFKELAPVIHLDSASMVLLANPAFPAKSVAEVVALARAKPGSVSCGISGALPQVGCEMLRAHAKTDMLLVQYKGNAPALNALIGGEVNLLFDLVVTAQGQVKAGRARAIASTNPKRGIGPFGDLPVVAETIPDFELTTWHGVMVPRATPRDVVTRLNRELAAVLGEPDVRSRLIEAGLEIAGGSPDAFERLLKRDYARYGKILVEAGVKPE